MVIVLMIAVCASGAVMSKIKRFIGLCDCPGCKKIAKEELTILKKSDNKKTVVRVCEVHAWELFEGRK